MFTEFCEDDFGREINHSIEDFIIEEMVSIMKKIVKIRFLQGIGYDPVETKKIEKLSCRLKELETIHPKCIQVYSTSNYSGYREDKSRMLFGERAWEKLRLTYIDLLGFNYVDCEG